MWRKQLIALFQHKSFKRVVFVLGVLFFLISIFVTVDPKPFLKFGYPGIFVASLLGVGTLLAIPLSVHFNTFWLAVVMSLGMAINDSVSWLVGQSGDAVVERSKKIEQIENSIHKYGKVALFFWSLIPFPYDLIGFIAGYLEFSYWDFMIPTILGRFVKFMILGTGIMAVFGAK
jgi:membrane protein YqaA with SNARE-associated domain